jgi:hypothetical protein
MKSTKKSNPLQSYVEATRSQSQVAGFLRDLRKERRRLLRRLKQIYVQVGGTSEEECRGLRDQAIRVVALSILLESLIQKSTVPDDICSRGS